MKSSLQEGTGGEEMLNRGVQLSLQTWRGPQPAGIKREMRSAWIVDKQVDEDPEGQISLICRQDNASLGLFRKAGCLTTDILFL